MPAGIDKLTSLQTLSLFVASKKPVATGGLRELTNLNNLRGNLEILHLEQVKFSPSNDTAKDAFLKNKEHLQHLTLRWDHDDDQEKSEEKKNSTTTPEFFDSLKELTISDCPNLRSWWKNDEILKNNRPSFTCISKLTIRCCPKLECMPLCTDLDEELVLVDSKVRSMRETEALLLPLSKLKSMVIELIEESPPQSWLKDFTSLEELHIRYCSNLKSLPQ
ncbi:CC-NBS-LRR resistance protein, partial [Trifolium medium]|nr:CC-NBS-LRR resistance protein [Trifolium medium]